MDLKVGKLQSTSTITTITDNKSETLSDDSDNDLEGDGEDDTYVKTDEECTDEGPEEIIKHLKSQCDKSKKLLDMQANIIQVKKEEIKSLKLKVDKLKVKNIQGTKSSGGAKVKRTPKLYRSFTEESARKRKSDGQIEDITVKQKRRMDDSSRGKKLQQENPKPMLRRI